MLLLKDNKMINESLNNKYYDMNALEVITYHPIIFARVFTHAIQRSMPLDSKDAEKIRDSLVTDKKESNIFYNPARFSIKGFEFEVKCEGSKFKLRFNNESGRSLEFNISKLSLLELKQKIQKEFSIFSKTHDLSYEERDKMGLINHNNRNELSDLEGYLRSLSNKYLGYAFHYDYEEKRDYSSLSITAKFTMSENRSSTRFEYFFQKEELNKIINLISSFLKRKYNMHFNIIRLSEYELYLHSESNNPYFAEVDLSKITDTSMSREKYYQMLITEVFEK